jgi:class 3 adenylate cyclase
MSDKKYHFVEETTQPLCDPPDDFAAVVLTDLQGSTSLWEFNSVAMQAALNVHDEIIRQCIVNHHGYEIKTEGDAFQILFYECCDATKFALQVQQALHDTPWSNDILLHPVACEDSDRGLRGLRVRMAIHYGPVTFHMNEITNRREYTGITMNITKSLENLAYGGQVLITSDAWNRICHLSPTVLRSPQVLDLGMYILLTGQKKNEGIIEKCVLQLVPRALAFDYTCHRKIVEELSIVRTDVEHRKKGRQFPMISSARRLSASFQDAPHEGNVVTIVFLVTTKVEELYDEPAFIQAALAKHVSYILRQFRSAYQCKDFMLAFSCPSDAIRFGLQVQNYLRNDNTVAGVNLKNMIKVGLHHGPFESMGPSLTTGRADYYGVVVNRAARIADAGKPGEVVIGMIASSAGSEEQLKLDSGLKTTFFARRTLKGIKEEMDLYNCRIDLGTMKQSSSLRSSRRVLNL